MGVTNHLLTGMILQVRMCQEVGKSLGSVGYNPKEYPIYK